MSKFLKALSLGVSIAALPVVAGAAFAGDAAQGEKVFKKCRACHAVGEGAKHKVGPELNDVFGRTAGSIDGFKYSKAMIAAGNEGLVWDETTMATYLEKPKAMIKGTKMAFAGLKKDDDVANVIAYLATFSSAAAAKEEEQSSAAPAADAETQTASADQPAAPVSATRDGGVFGLGREALPEEIAAWDIDIRPDGAGLPVGSGTVADGEVLYTDNCAVCHGDFGEGVGRWPVLAGGHDTLADERPEKTIGSYWPYLSTVYDYVRRAMPYGNARSLSDDDVYALTAYLLYLNDIVDDEDFELSNENFTDIRLPNEENFFFDDRDEEPHYAQKGEPCMSDCKADAVKITQRARILDVTPGSVDDDQAAAGGGVD
ncbi:c-type cytochrome [Roseibium aggregatum]|uniref:C-type cytochrome n=1 Tax=Roseibium aggregatum TaxID=187304 RepID=A0A939EG81_9HYPH|nr:c-type cytochrome [Roseibium aggregatum]MBN9672575.1 c-type cytochrome [Roseibium aggregatum]